MAVTLRTLLFALVLVGLFTSISIAYVTNLKDSYSVTTSSEFESTLAAMNQTSEDMWEAKTKFSDASQKITEGSILGGAISGATGVVEILKLPFSTMGTAINLTQSVASYIPIPTYATYIFYIMLTLAVVLIIIAAVLRYKYV